MPLSFPPWRRWRLEWTFYTLLFCLTVAGTTLLYAGWQIHQLQVELYGLRRVNQSDTTLIRDCAQALGLKVNP